MAVCYLFRTKKDRLKFHLVEPNTNEKKRTSRKRS